MDKKEEENAVSPTSEEEEENVVSPTPEEEEEDDEVDEEEYEVEEVVNKRTLRGKIQYLIKWKNLESSDNTWEPDENLECPELINEYEKRSKAEQTEMKSAAKSDDSKKRKSPDTSAAGDGNKQAKINNSEGTKAGKKGFARQLKARRIIGATDSGGALTFLMEWHGCNEADLVTSEEANHKCPEVVIQFYEERLRWHKQDALLEE